ncbi:MAG TPA: hypothetical protein VIH42_05980, partial [Thermoguttaceae bacterium]
MSLIVRFQTYSLIVFGLLWTVSASAQRIQFPSTVPPPNIGAAAGSPNWFTPASSYPYQPSAYPPSPTFS